MSCVPTKSREDAFKQLERELAGYMGHGIAYLLACEIAKGTPQTWAENFDKAIVACANYEADTKSVAS